MRYIAADNRTAAEALGLAVLERTRVLASFPASGRTVPEEHNSNVREIIVEPYRVIYEICLDGDRVNILRFWHGARGWPEL